MNMTNLKDYWDTEDNNEEEEYVITFTLHKGSSQEYRYKGVYHASDPWAVFMQRFVEFLEGTGYIGVKERVSIEDSPFLDGYWFGPVHDTEAMSVAKDLTKAANSVFDDAYEDNWK